MRLLAVVAVSVCSFFFGSITGAFIFSFLESNSCSFVLFELSDRIDQLRAGNRNLRLDIKELHWELSDCQRYQKEEL